MLLGRLVPSRVKLSEERGGPFADPIWRQKLDRQLGIQEGKAAPLVHQPDLGEHGFVAGLGTQTGEFDDELLVSLRDGVKIPGLVDQLASRADTAERTGKRIRATVEAELVKDL